MGFKKLRPSPPALRAPCTWTARRLSSMAGCVHASLLREHLSSPDHTRERPLTHFSPSLPRILRTLRCFAPFPRNSIFRAARSRRWVSRCTTSTRTCGKRRCGTDNTCLTSNTSRCVDLSSRISRISVLCSCVPSFSRPLPPFNLSPPTPSLHLTALCRFLTLPPTLPS